MDPVSVVGLVGSVVGITDIVVRSLKGLRSLQALYSTADRRVAMTRGNLQSVKGALDEIHEWAESLNEDAKTSYATLLVRLDFAVQCCAIPLEALCEIIESLKSEAEGGPLTRMGKLAVLLGDSEMREMSIHLGNQVQALNLLLMAAFCKTQQGCNAVLQDEETRSILRQVENDSASYMHREIETASVLTRRSVVSDHGEPLESTFAFDGVILDSPVYRQAFRTVIEERKRQRANGDKSNPTQTQIEMVDIPRQASAAGIATTQNAGLAQRKIENKPIEQPRQPKKRSQNRDQGFLSKFLRPAETSAERAARHRSEEIERVLLHDRMKSRSEVKMLLLGAMESGKSTVLKQMKLIYEGSYSAEQRESFKEIIFSNIVSSMRVLLEAMEALEIHLEVKENEYHVQTIFMQPYQIEEEFLTTELADALRLLWKDGGVQEAFRRRREFQLITNCAYWMKDLARISQPNYVPSNEDVLKSRVKTTGITETTFLVGTLTYRVFDTGGARSERKKWIHAFENVTVVIFTVDIAAYDMKLFEDETANRMQEELTLFDSICNTRWFTKSSMILFMNKIDVLNDKISTSPIKSYFPDYEGGPDYVAACDYFLKRFTSLNQNEAKKVYAHFVCATDLTQMRFVMDAVNDIIIADNLGNTLLI